MPNDNTAEDSHPLSSSRTKNISINTGKMLFKNAYQKIYDLREITQNLSKLTSDRVEPIKKQLNYTMELIRRDEVALKKKVNKRHKKREKLKHKRNHFKKERERERQEVNKQIDVNLNAIREKIVGEKSKEEKRQHIESQIHEIDRKREESSTYLSRLASLIFLRMTRKSYSNIDEDPNTERDFLTKITTLATHWKCNIMSLDADKSKLLRTLNALSNNTTVDDDDVAIKKRLFGDVEFDERPLSRMSLDELVEIRRDWDQFIAEDGTHIPAGWIQPTKNHAVLF